MAKMIQTYKKPLSFFISDLYYNTKEVISIANYLLAHYKGRYRIKAPYDISTNQFPRKLNGNFEDIDCYIDCQYGNKIFSFGHGTLQAYIPSLIRGHNIIKNIENNYSKDIIFDIEKEWSEDKNLADYRNRLSLHAIVMIQS